MVAAPRESIDPRRLPQRHVLRTVPSYFPYVTGPANQVRAISKGLFDQGFHSSVVTTNLGAASSPAQEIIDGVEVARLPIQMGLMQYHVVAGAWKECSQRPADIMHVHSYRNYLADVAALTARRRAIPLIVQLHGSLSGYRSIVERKGHWLYAAYDTLTRPLPTLRAARFIVSTCVEAHEAERFGLDSSRICIIPMGIDPDHYVFPGIARDPHQITFVGRLAEDRHVEGLLRSLALMRDLTWSCAVVGGEERRSYLSARGYVNRLKLLARDVGVAERIDFTGPLYGDELRQTYARSGIFVYPSRYENFGQTILEAAAAGCALVTTPVGVANDLIDDGASGFLIEQDKPELLTQRLRWLLEHPAEQAALGARARALVRQNFAWQPILRRYADLYHDAIDEYNCRGRRRPSLGADA